jgi:hypothetical protein
LQVFVALDPDHWAAARCNGQSARGSDPAGHIKIENTVRYFGVDVEDALTLAETEI